MQTANATATARPIPWLRRLLKFNNFSKVFGFAVFVAAAGKHIHTFVGAFHARLEDAW
jgi:hypothetical protein